MEPQSILLAFIFGAGIWLVLGFRRKRRDASRGGPPPSTSPAETEDRGTMPRIGKPGTLTADQVKELRRNDFTFDKGWSKEEAALILDTLAYLRAVCRHAAGGADAPLEVQNELLSFILIRQDLRDYLREWGAARRADRKQAYIEADDNDLPECPEFVEITTEARRLLDIQVN